MLIQNATTDPRYNCGIDKKNNNNDQIDFVCRDALCVPIFSITADNRLKSYQSDKKQNASVIAVLQVQNKKSGIFTEDDFVTLNFIAGISGHMLKNAILYQEVFQTAKKKKYIGAAVSTS